MSGGKNNNGRKDDRETSDPFEDYDKPEDAGPSADGRSAESERKPSDSESSDKGSPVRRRRLRPSQKVTYSAIGAALSVVMITISAWLPVTVAPLVLISLCYNIVTERCGIGYGIATIAVSVTLGFLCSAANVVILVLLAVTFVPYSLLCMPLARFGYSRPRDVAVRVSCVAAFACLDVFLLYKLANFILEYINLYEIIDRISGNNFAVGYTVLTLISVVIFIIVDVIYVFIGRRIVSKLK